MFENFPYTDMHQLNLDWIIKIAKDFLDQYTSLQQMISDGEQSLTDLTQDGLNDLQEKAETLQGLLDAWYTEHSTDIANQLADALQDLNAWYTEHQNYLNTTLQQNITTFDTHAEQKAAETIASIPDNYTDMSNEVTAQGKQIQIMAHNSSDIILTSDTFVSGTLDDAGQHTASNYRIHSDDYIDGMKKYRITVPSGWLAEIYRYNDNHVCLSYSDYAEQSVVDCTDARYIKILMKKSDASYIGTDFTDASAYLSSMALETYKETIDKFISQENYTIISGLYDDFELGTIIAGVETSEYRRMRSKKYYPTKGYYELIVPEGNTILYEVDYFDSNYDAITDASGTEAYTSKSSSHVTAGSNRAYFRLVCKRADNGAIQQTDLKGMYLILHNQPTQQGFVTVMAHNVGHFNNGNTGGYSGSDALTQFNNWKMMLSKYAPDIILAQEINSNFDSAETLSAENGLYKPLFPNYYQAGLGWYISKPVIYDAWTISLNVTIDNVLYERRGGLAKTRINGQEVILCSVHLHPGYTPTDQAVREAERDILLSELASYKYVIMGGDFNDDRTSFLTAFSTAGFFVENGGYFPKENTLAAEAPDNIIVKGFTPYNMLTEYSDRITSDHAPVVSKLFMLP